MRHYRESKRNGRKVLLVPTGELFLTKQEVAQRLQISTRTLEKWMRQRRVRFFKISKSVRFRFSELIKHLKANSEVS